MVSAILLHLCKLSPFIHHIHLFADYKNAQIMCLLRYFYLVLYDASWGKKEEGLEISPALYRKRGPGTHCLCIRQIPGL